MAALEHWAHAGCSTALFRRAHVSAAPENRTAVLTAVRKAVTVEGLRLQYADNRPSVPRAEVRRWSVRGVCPGPPARSIGQSVPAQPALCLPISSSMLPPQHGLSMLTRASGVLQGWQRLRRVLLFIAGTSLMDVAAALGFPPFQVELLCTLCFCHWLAVVCITLACLRHLAADSWNLIGLAISMLASLGLFFRDTAARANAVRELQGVSADAAALVASLQAAAPGQLPSLHAALAAWANCCADTEMRDQDRLNDVLTHRFAGLRLP